MTVEEWAACSDPGRMLEFLQGKASGRKLRLFACACCRLCWHLLQDPRGRRAVEVAERYVDGRASEEERAVVSKEAGQRDGCVATDYDQFGAIEVASARAVEPWDSRFVDAWGIAWACFDATQIGGRAARLFIPDPPRPQHIRCIFGNPFSPITISPSWLTSTVTSLAQGMYESRDFSAMPILADALQDAGCEDEAILAHCRGAGPHVRGCWCVDVILGKA